MIPFTLSAPELSPRVRMGLVAGVLSIAVAVFSSGAALAADAAEPAVVMKAGVARTVITPDDWNKLVTVMGTKASHKDHDLYARALVLNDGKNRLAIVTYDLNCLDVATPLLRVRCRDELKIDPSHLILLGTHNHAAPIQIVPDNFAYGRQLADRIFDVIKQAVASEQGPATVSVGQGPGYFVRSYGNAPADYEIQVLRVTVGQKPLAVLFNHPTHPLQSSNTRIDVGHPGYAVDDIETALPGVQAMYSDACGGNQFPDRGAIMFGTAQQVKELGRELADRVLTILKAPLTDVTGPIRSSLTVISLPLAEPLSYEAAKKLAADKKAPLDIGFVPYPHPDRGTNWIRSLLEHHEKKILFPKRTTDRVCTDDGFLVRKLDDGREFPCTYEEVIVSTVGPLCLIAMQGEVCAPIGMRVKDGLRRKMPLWVTSYMGEHNLYIPTRELVRMDAYQAQVIRIQYASPVGWSPDVEDEMVKGVLEAATKLTGEKPDLFVR